MNGSRQSIAGKLYAYQQAHFALVDRGRAQNEAFAPYLRLAIVLRLRRLPLFRPAITSLRLIVLPAFKTFSKNRQKQHLQPWDLPS
jgi:hypothetical protein